MFSVAFPVSRLLRHEGSARNLGALDSLDQVVAGNASTRLGRIWHPQPQTFVIELDDGKIYRKARSI